MTQVLEWVQSFRFGLVSLHVVANEMDPISRREAQRKADEKVHLLRHMQHTFVAVNRRQQISAAPLKVRTGDKFFNGKKSFSIYLYCIYLCLQRDITHIL